MIVVTRQCLTPINQWFTRGDPEIFPGGDGGIILFGSPFVRLGERDIKGLFSVTCPGNLSRGEVRPLPLPLLDPRMVHARFITSTTVVVHYM